MKYPQLMRRKRGTQKYVMYDGRARGDPDDADVLDWASSISEVIRCNARHRGEDFAWYSYDEIGRQLVNGVIRPDLFDLTKRGISRS
jgi:hypothetical protein